jgi:protein-S-isoprenylcysteine O-methyltransferase Ste14
MLPILYSILDQERLRISPLHRFVRHPWYSLGLIIIWSRDMTEAWLITCVLATLYFIFGSRLEEAKLMRYHGEAYRRYRAAVPALLPLPWRYLSGEESARLLASARGFEHRSD